MLVDNGLRRIQTEIQPYIFLTGAGKKYHKNLIRLQHFRDLEEREQHWKGFPQSEGESDFLLTHQPTLTLTVLGYYLLSLVHYSDSFLEIFPQFQNPFLFLPHFGYLLPPFMTLSLPLPPQWLSSILSHQGSNTHFCSIQLAQHPAAVLPIFQFLLIASHSVVKFGFFTFLKAFNRLFLNQCLA